MPGQGSSYGLAYDTAFGRLPAITSKLWIDSFSKPFMLLAYVNAVPSSFCSQSFLELEARGMVATVFRMQVFHAAEALLV